MSAATYRRAIGAGSAGQPDYVLPAAIYPPSGALHVSLPALATAEAVTIVLEADRWSADGLFMLVGLPDSRGGFTDLGYLQNYGGLPSGLAENTYNSGFWIAPHTSPFDNAARVQVVVRFYRYQQGSKFALFLNGQKQPLTYTGYQEPRDFTGQLVLGDTNGIPWNGTIYAAQVYLRGLPDAVCRTL